MSEISKRIDATIREGLAPLLKTCGFRKRARNFYREHSDRIDVINVQASRWNDATEAQFTINVGVYFPAISAITEMPTVTGMPKEYDCTTRERIGSLREDNKDHWWSIDRSSDDSAVALDVARQVEEVCLPWLDWMSNLDAVKKALAKEKRSFVAAGVALHQGKRNEAQDLLKASLTEQPRARTSIVAWAKKHDLEVSPH